MKYTNHFKQLKLNKKKITRSNLNKICGIVSEKKTEKKSTLTDNKSKLLPKFIKRTKQLTNELHKQLLFYVRLTCRIFNFGKPLLNVLALAI